MEFEQMYTISFIYYITKYMQVTMFWFYVQLLLLITNGRVPTPVCIVHDGVERLVKPLP